MCWTNTESIEHENETNQPSIKRNNYELISIHPQTYTHKNWTKPFFPIDTSSNSNTHRNSLRKIYLLRTYERVFGGYCCWCRCCCHCFGYFILIFFVLPITRWKKNRQRIDESNTKKGDVKWEILRDTWNTIRKQNAYLRQKQTRTIKLLIFIQNNIGVQSK